MRPIDADALANELNKRTECCNYIADRVDQRGLVSSDYTRGKADAYADCAYHVRHIVPTIDAGQVQHGHWVYDVSINGCEYHVKAHCSACGFKWYSETGIGDSESVFSTIITNVGSNLNAAMDFVINNAKANNTVKYCSDCGAKMDGEE